MDKVSVIDRLSSKQSYVIDIKTRNLSFLKMHRYLRDRGIENNKFFLRLYDKDLVGVDPYSKRLTRDQERKILAECRRNPFFYLREIARVRIPGGLARFELHPGNLAAVWAIFNSLDLILLLPRQRYKTFSIAAALCWVYDFGTTNTHMLFGNKSLGDAKNNLKRFKAFRQEYPKFIQEAVIDPADTDNLESVESAKYKNKIDVAGQPTNIGAADKQGRGMGIPIWWPDELKSSSSKTPLTVWKVLTCNDEDNQQRTLD